MNCIYMYSELRDLSPKEPKYMDIRFYRESDVPAERIRDEFLYLLLQRALQYEMPRHVDLSLSSDETIILQAVVRFNGGPYLYAVLRREEISEEEENTLDFDTMDGKESIPHYGVDMRRGCAFIHDYEYTKETYPLYLEKLLKGDLDK